MTLFLVVCSPLISNQIYFGRVYYELDDLLMKVRPLLLALCTVNQQFIGIVNDVRTSKCRSLIFLFRMQLPIVS